MSQGQLAANLTGSACYTQALKAENVEFIVAPYEADAQMAFLAINGKVDAVLTEDSDMLPYGCPRVSTQQHTSFCYFSRVL